MTFVYSQNTSWNTESTLLYYFRCQQYQQLGKLCNGSGSENLKHPSFNRTASVIPNNHLLNPLGGFLAHPEPLHPMARSEKREILPVQVFSLPSGRTVEKAGISGTLHLLPPGLEMPQYVRQPVETPVPTPEVAETSAGATEKIPSEEEDADLRRE